MLVDPAIRVVKEALAKGKGKSDDLRLKAAIAVLDRTGHHPGQDIHVSGELSVDSASATAAVESKLASLIGEEARRPEETSERIQ